jgi:hypothetical protein
MRHSFAGRVARPGARIVTSVRMTTTSFLLTSLLAAQTCPDQGSQLVAATWSPSPLALGCAGAPAWPQWHAFTPAHRAPVPHAGFRPGTACALPRLLVTWRCTGFLLVPVVPTGLVVSGYVIDRPEHDCTAAGA